MIDSRDLSAMRATQTAHMMDTCVIQSVSATTNALGEVIETWADGSAQACGLDMRQGSERRSTANTALKYDATLRMSITATPNPRDRIKVTKRFGETLSTALIFQIVGPVQRGPSGIRLLLEKVDINA